MTFHLDIDEELAPVLLDTDKTGITQEIANAGTYLNNALVFWRMLDPDKAALLKQMLNEELRVPQSEGLLRLRRGQVERLVKLLEGIETAPVGRIMNKSYHVLPDQIDYVNKHAPGLAVRTTDGEGNVLYVLDRITEVEWLRAFLDKALQLGCDVIQT
jgi:hypothetical protein